MSPRPVVALVATPKFKKEHKERLQHFVCEHLYTLVYYFDVISTGRTHDEISRFLREDAERLKSENKSLIKDRWGCNLTRDSLPIWRRSIHRRFKSKLPGIEGMIEIAHELVTGKLEAVIQLSVEDDTTVRAGSAVLRREANVHNVPIASDIATAELFVQYWKNKLNSNGGGTWSLFRSRKAVFSPCAYLPKNGGDNVLALIAHDGQKHEMCRFVVEYQDKLRRFTHILATGTSGKLAKRYLSAAGWDEKQVERIMPCKSGPLGGDVEIANAVIQGLCNNVVFFQDPAISHPHAADIRLFEQAMLTRKGVRLASNAESARILLNAIEPLLSENGFRGTRVKLKRVTKKASPYGIRS
jgi:methylglyoxal synthase